MKIIDPYTSLTAFSDKQIKSNERLKKQSLEFIKEADFKYFECFSRR